MFAERANRHDHSVIPTTAIPKLRTLIRCCERGKKPSSGLHEASMATDHHAYMVCYSSARSILQPAAVFLQANGACCWPSFRISAEIESPRVVAHKSLALKCGRSEKGPPVGKQVKCRPLAQTLARRYSAEGVST